MLARAKGSERRGVVFVKCLECREREIEMRCKCLKYVKESRRGSERKGVVICRVFWSAEREREMYCKGSKYVRERERGSERRGVVICKVLGVHRERERCAVSA